MFIQCLSTLSWIELSRDDYLAVQLTHEQAGKLVEEGGWAGTQVDAQLMEDRAQFQAELGDLKEAEKLYLAALAIRGKWAGSPDHSANPSQLSASLRAVGRHGQGRTLPQARSGDGPLLVGQGPG